MSHVLFYFKNIWIYSSWCYFLLLLRPCCRRLQTIWNFPSHQYSFDYIMCACVSMVMKSFVNRDREKGERKKKLILSFRVSRCQGVMFYLKENNLRYWSVGVCLLFFTFSARMHSSDQTHVKIIFCFYISPFIWRMFKWCIVMHYWFLSNRCIYFFSHFFIQYYIGKNGFYHHLF